MIDPVRHFDVSPEGKASFYDRHVLPWLIDCACSSKAVSEQRARVVPDARGRVLELGVGSGLNLPFYDPAKVAVVQSVEPSEPLRRKAEQAARRSNLKVEILPGRAEALPFEVGVFDTVVCTFTLCSVQDPSAALREARRVLKPGGQLLFCEHGLAPDAGVAAWQRRIEPIWKRIAGGCHLTRPVAAAIAAAGFRLQRVETAYLPKTPHWAGWNEWGAAVPD